MSVSAQGMTGDPLWAPAATAPVGCKRPTRARFVEAVPWNVSDKVMNGICASFCDGRVVKCQGDGLLARGFVTDAGWGPTST